ncbi:MAG: DUF1295 domain-containing protein [candidate division Zixibacteria bacterium]|nr:DUF1295 domain-containing protein [candidate division Zixibacteria bacterium]
MQQEEHGKPYILDWIAGAFTFLLLVLDRFLQRGRILFLNRIGVAILIGAIVLAFLPIFTLRKYGRVQKGKSYMNTSVVVDRGFYSVVRHPQYLAYMLFNAGFMLTSQNCFIVLLGALAITFFYLHAIDEEKFCRKKFGEEYERDAKRVPVSICLWE